MLSYQVFAAVQEATKINSGTNIYDAVIAFAPVVLAVVGIVSLLLQISVNKKAGKIIEATNGLLKKAEEAGGTKVVEAIQKAEKEGEKKGASGERDRLAVKAVSQILEEKKEK